MDTSGADGACASCGTTLPARAKFCPECGTASAPVEQVAGQRRQVTVLFADLVDSTLVSQQVDPEDFAEAVLAYQESGRRIVDELGGHLANYLGDGLLGLFGYPVAHEDDALRAIRAGLALQTELVDLRRRFPAVPLAARVGIHTGLTVVGAMGSSDRLDTSAFGDTPNIAARVEGAADPDSVTISATTHALVERFVVADELGPHELKGVLEPLRLYRVVEVSDIGNARPGLPFVGRGNDLDVLVERWADTEAGGSHVVFVRGEAGIGKSRLVSEFSDRLDIAPVNRLHGACSPVNENTAYQPFVNLIERLAGVGPTSPPAVRRKGLLDLLDRWELYDPVLLHLLEIAPETTDPVPSPERIRYDTQRALGTLLDRILAQGPTVLFVDDLHWADPSTRELMGRLTANRRPGLFVLGTLRPDVALPDGTESADVIDLGPLPHDAAMTLARHAGDGALDDATLATIVERSGGIPLFVEELVRGAATGVDATVPASLHDSLMARLDQLGPARPVAQVASVLGRDFSRSLLRAVVPTAQIDEHLDALVDAGLAVPVPGVAETFTFRHALIRDAAYESMLRSERRRLHGRVADTLQAMDVVSPEQVALHRAGAGAALEAGRWYHRAGMRSASQGAYREALAHFADGLVALEGAAEGRDRDEVELQLQLMVGNAAQSVHGFGTPANEPVWTRALELAESLGDLDEATSAMNGLFVMHNDRGECAVGRELALRIIDRSRGGRSRAGLVRGHSSVSISSLYLGEPERAREHARRAIAEYRESDFYDLTYGIGTDQGVVAHGGLGAAAWMLGDHAESEHHLDEAVALGRRLDSMISTAIGLMFGALVRLLERDYERVVDLAEELISLGTMLDSAQPLGFGRLARDAALAHLDPRESLAGQVAETAAAFGGPGAQGGAPVVMAVLAETYRVLDDHQSAADLAELGLALSAASGERFVDTELHRVRAEVLHARGDLDAATTAFDDALAAADACDSFALRLRSEVARAGCAVDSGGAPRLDRLAALVATAPAAVDTPDLARARALLHRHHEDPVP